MSDADPKFWLWIDGEASGPYDAAKIYRNSEDRNTLYWSPKLQAWRPVSHFPGEEFPLEERLGEMKRAGITKVQYLDSGRGDDCAICQKMNGYIFDIDNVPPIPIEGCICDPWPRSIYISIG